MSASTGTSGTDASGPGTGGPRRRSSRLIAVDGAMALIAVLLMVQMWLLTASLEAVLAGHSRTAIPGAIISGLLFAACYALYRFVVRLR